MTQRLRILVVEDNPADVDFIVDALQEAGPVRYDVESVPRLSEAIARLERADIDIVLLDLGLPDSQGLSTLHALRLAAADVPVVVLTGSDDQELAVVAVHDGAQDFLVKGPYGGGLMKRAIRYAVERKHAELAKDALEAQLRQSQKMESVGLLAGGVAHELNNMMAVILGNVGLALGQVAPTLPPHADLLEIQTAATRVAHFTRHLLAFARKQHVERQVLDFNETVPRRLSMLQRLVGDDIQLAWEPAAALWTVAFDPLQLDQILTNLCVNARRAMADVGTISLGTANTVVDATFCTTHADAVPGEFVRLFVRDTGSGMNEAMQARIFEPFYTTKGVGEGPGLGLPSVYGAIRQNDGFITVSSTVGEGTTFEIYVPRFAGG